MVAEIWTALGFESRPALAVTGAGALDSAFPVTPLATATIGAATAALAELVEVCGHDRPAVAVDRRLASLWFGRTLLPQGWSLPDEWDPIAGDYETRDGWIRLHTNAPHHRAVAEAILGPHADKHSMKNAVASWQGEALESEIVKAGGCAAMMRSPEQWHEHPQGQALCAEPLIAWHLAPNSVATAPEIAAPRPLRQVKVLDLTRVLAGPVAGRFLAGFGAQVLRVDPPWWNEPALAPEVTVGKRCTGLDLRENPDRVVFEQLLGEADVFLHGYRPGALDHLGYGETQRRAINPALVDVCLDAYGWTGPWAERRGFDSLVQMSSGIAAHGMQASGANRPVPLPVQALDHATGYLLAAAVLKGLRERCLSGSAVAARLSLARTARLLLEHREAWQTLVSSDAPPVKLRPVNERDYAVELEPTGWGPARRLNFPVTLSGCPVSWPHPATPLRSSGASWAT
ncbi:MAG: CoA transferase [Gammaproteobacteria bacterium]|nr:CoA transferase [Gammaproteobacteria bacterium]